MPNFGFTTTPRVFKSDGVDNYAKLTTATIAGLTDREFNNLRKAIKDIVGMVNPTAADTTMSISASLTSGSLCVINCTL